VRSFREAQVRPALPSFFPADSTPQHNMATRMDRMRSARWKTEQAMNTRMHAPRLSWPPGRFPRPHPKDLARLLVAFGELSVPPAQTPAVSTQRLAFSVSMQMGKRSEPPSSSAGTHIADLQGRCCRPPPAVNRRAHHLAAGGSPPESCGFAAGRGPCARSSTCSVCESDTVEAPATPQYALRVIFV